MKTLIGLILFGLICAACAVIADRLGWIKAVWSKLDKNPANDAEHLTDLLDSREAEINSNVD